MNSVAHTNFIHTLINTHAYCILHLSFSPLNRNIRSHFIYFVVPSFAWNEDFWFRLRSNQFIVRSNKQTIQNESICVQCLHNEQTELNWKTRYHKLHSTASKHRAWNMKFNANSKWTCFSHCICVCVQFAVCSTRKRSPKLQHISLHLIHIRMAPATKTTTTEREWER